MALFAEVVVEGCAPSNFGTLMGVIFLIGFAIAIGLVGWARFREEQFTPPGTTTPVTLPRRGVFWGCLGIALILLLGAAAIHLWEPCWMFFNVQKKLGGTVIVKTDEAGTSTVLFEETGTTVKWADKRKDKDGGYLVVDLGKAKTVVIARDSMGTDPMECDKSGKYGVKDNWGDVPARLVIVVYTKDGKLITRDVAAVMTEKK